MSIFKCKMCGGDLDIAEGVSITECEYCGTKQTVPKAVDENLQNLFNRANTLRIKGEFDKAEKIYENIVQLDPTQSDAYWGLILCRYGIEYVDDPKTFKKIPTCHRASYDSIIADADYKSAIENADGSQRSIYEEQAREIDRIQKDILALAQNEEAYDVFICYKETDSEGKRTQDSVIANDIYYQLKQEGFKVFYAAITLEGKLGSAYEPIIFAALNSAKVMLVIGTKPEYFNAVWVKNEWSRFLKIIKNDRSKLLIPCYRDMDAYDFPDEFAHLQAQDMSKIGFINDIVRGIEKVIKKDAPEATAGAKGTVAAEAGTNTAPLIKRAFLFLEDSEWNSANEYGEKVLDLDPECAEAYLIKLMAELHINKREDLKNFTDSFSNNPNYQKVIRFGDERIKSEFDEIFLSRNEKTYNKAVGLLDKGCYFMAIRLLKQIEDYKDSKALLDKAKSNGEYVLSSAKLNGKYGIINENGEFVVEPRFDYAEWFSDNGLFEVQINGKYGYIDESGNYVTKPKFGETGIFSKNGLANVKSGGMWGYIDESGEFVIEPWFDHASFFGKNGFAKVRENGEWGFINEFGEFVIEPQFDEAERFQDNGLAKVKVNGKWGYIDKSGEFVIKPRFDEAEWFDDNGLTKVKVNGKWGYIDKSDEYVIEPRFDDAKWFHDNGLAAVEINGKWGYIDKSGEFVIEPKFGEAGSFSENGLACVLFNFKWGYIDKSGEFVIEPRFNDAGWFCENGLASAKTNGKWGYIDKTGEFVIEPQFDWAYNFDKMGIAQVVLDGKWGFIHESGEFVIEPKFESLGRFNVLKKDTRNKRTERIGIWKQKLEEKRIADEKRAEEEERLAEERRIAEIKAHNDEIRAKIEEAENALSVQKAIYAENANKIFGAGARLKKTSKAEISILEDRIFDLKQQFK